MKEGEEVTEDELTLSLCREVDNGKRRKKLD